MERLGVLPKVTIIGVLTEPMMKIYNRLQKLERQGLIEIERKDGKRPLIVYDKTLFKQLGLEV